MANLIKFPVTAPDGKLYRVVIREEESLIGGPSAHVVIQERWYSKLLGYFGVSRPLGWSEVFDYWFYRLDEYSPTKPDYAVLVNSAFAKWNERLEIRRTTKKERNISVSAFSEWDGVVDPTNILVPPNAILTKPNKEATK